VSILTEAMAAETAGRSDGVGDGGGGGGVTLCGGAEGLSVRAHLVLGVS
jgi:hypothetical protein